jgi:hypothetical protein
MPDGKPEVTRFTARKINWLALDLQKYARPAHFRDIVTLDVHSYVSHNASKLTMSWG